jgi:hypothetical protein
MSFSVGLYRDFARKGGITFSTVPASHPSDYDCKPEGVLSHDQAEHVSWQLRRTPTVCQGAVGKYVWRQEEA